MFDYLYEHKRDCRTDKSQVETKNMNRAIHITIQIFTRYRQQSPSWQCQDVCFSSVHVNLYIHTYICIHTYIYTRAAQIFFTSLH